MKSVTPSSAWRTIGIITLLLGVVGAVCSAFLRMLPLLVCACILLGASLLCWAAWYSVFITFGPQGWTFRRWFFPQKHYTLNDIRSITFGTPAGGFTLRLKCRRIYIGARAENGTAFRAWVEKGYLRVNQKPLPYEPPHIFHNNIKNPWTFLSVSVGVGLLTIAMAICTTIGLSAPREIPVLTERCIMVGSISSKGDYAQLSADTGDFTVPLWKHTKHLETYVGCNILIQVENSRDKTDSSLIWSATDTDGKVLFTSQEVCDYLTRLDSRNILLMWAITLLYWLLFAASCFILNHASAHPHLAALLVKPDQRNF